MRYLVFCSLLISFVLSTTVVAETLRIEGMSFNCVECVLEDGEPCRVRLRASEPAVACDSVLKTLLLDVLNDSAYTGKYPKPSEIIAAIKSNKIDSSLTSTLLSILVKTKSGEDRLQKEAGLIARRYSKELSELLSSKPVSDASLMAIWKTQDSEGIVLPAQLAAQIAAGNRQIKVRDFVARMQASSIKSEKDLAIFSKEFKEAGRTDVSKSFDEAIAILDTCSTSITRCREEETLSLPSYLRLYVASFLERRRKEHSDRNALDPGRTLDELISSSTASVHGVLRRDRILGALRNAFTAEDASIRLNILSADKLEFLRAEASRDPGIALAVASLMVKSSGEEFARGANSTSARLLNNSFAFYDLPIKEREALVEQLGAAPGDILEKVSNLPDRLRAEPVKKSAFWFWVIASLAVVWLWATFVMLMRRRSDRLLDNEARDDIAAWKADRKKRDLLAYFGLSEKATLEDLTRRYREIVKESHPDVAGGAESSSRDFAELREKYELARDLLFDSAGRK